MTTATHRLRHLASIRNSNVDKKSLDGEIRVQLCNYTDVYYNDTIDDAIPFMDATATPEEVSRFTLRESQVLMTKDSESADDIGIPAYVRHSMPGIVCGYHLTQLTPTEDTVGRFLFWCLMSRELRAWFEVSARGVTRYALGQDAIGNAPIPTPPLRTQRRIADFLDRETARIDALIDKKRRLIDLLEEKSTATITHAVTKGLDPAVPMKDSGIPWIGEIPEHWSVAQLRRALDSITDGPFGSALTSDHYSESGARVVRLGNIGDGEFEDTDRAYISMDYYQELGAFALRDGDIVMAGLGDDRRGLGRAAGVPKSLLPAILKADCYRLRANRDIVDGEYTVAFLSSSAGTAGAVALSRGTTRQRINTSIARELPLVMPPQDEQVSIVEEIETVRSMTKRAVASIDAQLILLAEYREALITAAVTGEIDVDTFDSDRKLEVVTP